MPLLSRFGLAWIVGIALARWLNLLWPAIVSLPALGALFLYLHAPRVQTWAALGLAVIAAAFRFVFFQSSFDETHLAPTNSLPENLICPRTPTLVD